MQGVTKRGVAEKLGIHDVGRLKVWVRQYKINGAERLQDRRGGGKKPVERDGYHQ
nr:helix-turn-helix domain-containing protein [Melghirimyces profundicolus]